MGVTVTREAFVSVHCKLHCMFASWRVNHELKVSAQQVISQDGWQYQLAHSGCQGYRQVRGWASRKHASPFYIRGWKRSQASSCGGLVLLNNSITDPKKQQTGRRSRLPTQPFMPRTLYCRSRSSNWVKDEISESERIEDQRRASVCVSVRVWGS